MSTKMSTDLNITRPTSRVIRPPGGTASNIFGTYEEPTATRAKTPASPAKPAQAETVAPPAPPAPARNVDGKVAIVVGGSVEPDTLVEKINKALFLEGVKGAVVFKVADIQALPFAVQNASRSVDVVVAAAFLPNDPAGTITSAMNSTLLQMGLSGRTPVVSAVVNAASLLEAKALLPTHAEGWAKSVVAILDIKNAPTVEFTPAPEPVIHKAPELTSDLNKTEDLMEVLRENLKNRGARGIVGLSRKFRIADDDNSGFIDYAEFQKVISEHALGWTNAQVKLVFDFFDADRSGSISFDEFVVAIRGHLNDRRRNLVLQAFQILDADKSGVVELNDISAKYDASKHPDVIAGKRSIESVLSEFLDTFDTEEKDGKVTPSEFCKYYSNVSASIDEDDYFELMIRNAWHISGGEGWCANSSCRRVLVTHTGGRQTVEEIKNDLGIKADDKEAMIANLRGQGIIDITDIELSDGSKTTAKNANGAPTSAKPQAESRPTTGYGRRAPGGKSSLVLG
jgi:Ca2+-binding EF-hand superfamily protein